MLNNATSIRPFIGAKNFKESSNFYKDLGFEEVVLSTNLSLFKTNSIAFYLQDAYVKDWVDNTMVFVEIADVAAFWQRLVTLHITSKYPTAKIVPIKQLAWGSECFVHDPSGILWHFGTFKK
ncbi:glyoxalase [Parasediminibacterium paludis]|uniref:Glyoxalase n=1 Tax=Parasediminibacterium paludis TaxID=908966 RepID=A0ABV8PXM3_9BACT